MGEATARLAFRNATWSANRGESTRDPCPKKRRTRDRGEAKADRSWKDDFERGMATGATPGCGSKWKT